MSDYLTDEYVEELNKKVKQNFKDEHKLKALSKKIEDAKDLIKQLEKEKDLIHKDRHKLFSKIVMEDIQKTAIRQKVSFEKFFKDGMYECMSDPVRYDDYYINEYSKLSNLERYEKRKISEEQEFAYEQSDKKELLELYNELEKQDSDNIHIWVSPIFRDYSDDNEFYTEILMMEEAKSSLVDYQNEYWEMVYAMHNKLKN